MLKWLLRQKREFENYRFVLLIRIHGGKNALRFTPHFLITSAEIDLVITKIREALKRGPVYS